MAWSYTAGGTPKKSVCGECGNAGVKLWRGYNSFTVRLECETCVTKGCELEFDNANKYSLGGSVLAVPHEEGVGYWGFCAIPQDGIAWWNNLPSVEQRRM